MTAFDPSTVRDRFPALAPSHDGDPVIYADAPGGSQVPDTVIEAVAGHYRGGISNAGGAFAASEEIDGLVLGARASAADLVGARPDQIVFGANATTLLMHVSRSFTRTLAPGDTVVVTRLDHDANIRPWALAARDAGADLRWIDLDPGDATLDVDSFDEALARRPRLVAFTLASNGVGTITPAADLVARAKAAGALVAVDGVHLAQHRAIEFSSLGADLLAVSAYKVFGPHVGFLAASHEILDAWDAYRVRPADAYDPPERWESGTLNHEGLAGLIAAVDYLAQVGASVGGPGGPSLGLERRSSIVAAFEAIGAHERVLASRFLAGVAAMPAIRLYGIDGLDRLQERTPTFAVRVGDQDPRDTSKRLADRGIFTWDGHYYAMELFERLGILDSGGAVRIGFCHYHTTEEVDRVLEAMRDLV